MKQTILILAFLVTALILKAQLFNDNSIYPNTTSVKGKYFNGTGGKGHWSFQKIDSLGRIVEYNSFRKKKLLVKDFYKYNDKNDIIYIVHAYDINRPTTIDTTKYEYAYVNNRIEFQKCTYANGDSTIYRLIKNQDDSILTYQNIHYHYLKDKKMNNTVKETYILTYQNNLLITKELIDANNKREVTNFAYYDNGKLKRRTVKRTPEYDLTVTYVGGPGSDDQFYKYTFDNEGRVKNYYTIVGDKTYKLATYNYKNE